MLIQLLTFAVVIVLNLFIILVNEWLEEQLDLVRLRVELHQEGRVVVLKRLQLLLVIVLFVAIAWRWSLRLDHLGEVEHEDDIVLHDRLYLLVHLLMASLLLQQLPVLHKVDVEVVHLLIINLRCSVRSLRLGELFGDLALLVDLLKDVEVGLHDLGDPDRVRTLTRQHVPEVLDRDALQIFNQRLHLRSVVLLSCQRKRAEKTTFFSIVVICLS